VKKPRPLPLVLYIHAKAIERYGVADAASHMLVAEVSPGARLTDEQEREYHYPNAEYWPSKAGRIRVKDLGFAAWLGPGRLPFGYELEYRDVFSVDAGDAKAMLQVLTTLQKRLDGLRDRFGPADFMGWVRRVVDVLGIDEVRIYRDTLRAHEIRAEGENCGAYSKFDLGQGCALIERIVEHIAGPAEERKAV